MSWWDDHWLPTRAYNAYNEISEQLSKDWNDYEALYTWRKIPIVGEIFRARQDELAYLENKRWIEDNARAWGYDTNDWKYPIRMGLYGDQGYTTPFEASIGVATSLFGKRLYKW